MIANPITAIEKGWVLGDIKPEQIQPNGIDLTLEDVLQVDKSSSAYVTPKSRRILDRESILEGYSMVSLEQGEYYELISAETINVPENMSAEIWLRSTLVRSGAVKTSGWYDSGYRNKASVHVFQAAGRLTLERGVRFCQIIFSEASSAHMYDGVYNKGDIADTSKELANFIKGKYGT